LNEYVALITSSNSKQAWRPHGREGLGGVGLFQLNSEGMRAIDIHMGFEAIISPDVMGDSTVTKYLRGV
jgi:hypothetical protein